MEKEIWKPVVGYEGFYEVSNLGRVRSLVRRMYDLNKQTIEDKPRIKILSPSHHRSGYLLLTLTKDGVVKRAYVHRLVADAFLDKKNETDVVNHKDLNKTNNCVCNLEYISFTENMAHAWKNGACKSKLTVDDVRDIRNRFALGETPTQIQSDYQFVSVGSIRNVVSNKTWRWVS